MEVEQRFLHPQGKLKAILTHLKMSENSGKEETETTALLVKLSKPLSYTDPVEGKGVGFSQWSLGSIYIYRGNGLLTWCHRWDPLDQINILLFFFFFPHLN